MTPPRIFDRARWRRARARSGANFASYDFLHRRAFSDIVDRIESTSRRFGDVLIYGVGPLAPMPKNTAGARRLLRADIAAERLGADGVVFDEERSALAPQSFDLIVSLLTLHTAEDPVGALAQYRAALKPDGFFVGALFAEETLCSLRRCLYAAETGLYGGVSPRISPFSTLKDLGGLLQRTGFALPVVDIDRIEVRYANAQRLLADLKGMGETGILAARPRPLTRRLISTALDGFAVAGGVERFEIAYLTGWAPHPNQQQPLKPGSAKQSLESAVRNSGERDKAP